MTLKIPGIGESFGAGASSLISGGSRVASGKATERTVGLGNKILPGLGEALTGKTDVADLLTGKAVDRVMELIGGAKMGTRVTGLLADINGRADPLWQRDWAVEMPILHTWKAVTLGRGKFGRARENKEVSVESVSLSGVYVEEIQMPMISIETDGVFQQGTRRYFPQMMDIGSVTINFYVDQDLKALQYIDFWRKQVQSNDGYYNYPDDFKYPITIYAQGPDADSGEVGARGNIITPNFCQWTLEGCWPSRPNNLSFTSGTSDRHVLSVEFSVDSLSFESFVQPSQPESVGSKIIGGIKTGLAAGLLGNL